MGNEPVSDAGVPGTSVRGIDISFLDVQVRTGWGRTLENFADWCTPSANARILDVGCGPGLLPALFTARGSFAVGIDLDRASLADGPGHIIPAPILGQSYVEQLPFMDAGFDLVTACNLLFLLPDPLPALCEMRRVVRTGGQVCVLNPSEQMSTEAARAVADRRGLQGLERESLLGWAARAEDNRRWNEPELQILFDQAGLRLVESVLKVGPGLARFARGEPKCASEMLGNSGFIG